MVHEGSVNDVSVDVGDSPGRNKRRWLVICGLDRRKRFLHEGSDCNELQWDDFIRTHWLESLPGSWTVPKTDGLTVR
jgi:hypothetical protein